MDVNAVAGSHIDQILQARAVPRYLIRVVCLDSGDQALLGRRDLYVQLLNHERHLLCAPTSRDGESGGAGTAGR
jgi:hypothetical protein